MRTSQKVAVALDARLKRLLERFDLDQAVVLALLTRALQAVFGGVTLVLIAYYFSPEVQGFYYTFASLVALQAFVELGLYIVIVSRASHEWSKLQVDASGSVTGEASALSRLASLARLIARWYTGISLVFVLAVGIAGYAFLSATPSTSVSWQAPWAAVVALAAVQLWLMPYLSLLEGCNQVVALNRLRLQQAVLEAFVMWCFFAAGAELWVAAASLGTKILATLYFLVLKYGRFLRSLMAAKVGERIDWRNEVWPMQWRLAAQGVMNYFVFSLFTPVMFHYHGAKAAGQMGMTLQIISVVTMMAHAWLHTKVPRFGMLVAKREFGELDKMWRRASKIALGFFALGGTTIWVAILALGALHPEFASRLLDPLPTALFIVSHGLMQVSYFQALYLRAHAREPYLALGVLGGLLIGALVLTLGGKYGPTGAATAFLMAIALFMVPGSTMIWVRRRAEWQRGACAS